MESVHDAILNKDFLVYFRKNLYKIQRELLYIVYFDGL